MSRGVDTTGKIPVLKIEELDYVIYAVQPKQYACLKETPLLKYPDEAYSEHIGYGGSAGGGKSFLARVVCALVAMMWPGSTSIIFRKTEREVVENHVNKFMTEVPMEIDGHRLYSWNGEDMCARFANGSRIYFGYLKEDKDVHRYQGPEYDCMVFEEATHQNWFRVNYLVSSRLRATVKGSRPFVLYPSNPGSEGHYWYKRLFIDRDHHLESGEKPENYTFIQAHLDDNQDLVRRDPKYRARLEMLPEPWKSWLLLGDWKAGAGTAIADLDRVVHMIKPFVIPPHWVRFGSFDWGYFHPFGFGEWAKDEDGVLYLLHTVSGRLLQPVDIFNRIKNKVNFDRLEYTVAGHDLWAKRRAYGQAGETLWEHFSELGMSCIQAEIDRVQGLAAIRWRINWKNTGPDGGRGQPRVLMFDEPGNKETFKQLETRTVDPKDTEDVIKTDADDWGEGGDDLYDMFRYGVASLSSITTEEFVHKQSSAFSPETLAHEVETKMIFKDDLRDPREIPNHPEFGEMY